jgi:hypothetical protein
MTWVNRLRLRWELKTNTDVWVVLFIFAITGSSTVFIRKPIFHFFNLNEAAIYIKILAYMAIIFPSYQIMFLIWGFLLRQWAFVWKFEKKILARFGIKIK